MTGKVVVITGASEGIGEALAKVVGAQGNTVVLAARREKLLRQVAEEIGGKTLAVETDVTRRADVEHLRDAALQAFGQVDVWVNNAGQGITKPVLELTEEELDEVMRVNLKSALYGMQTIVPHFMLRGSGHVINISSVLSRVPFVAPRAAYSASKAALNILTANLRMDLAAHPDIHVSLVLPGIVRTKFFEHAIGGTPNWHQVAGAVGSQSAEEVAEVIADVIDNPRAEVYTNPASADVVRRYHEDVAGFEANLRKRG